MKISRTVYYAVQATLQLAEFDSGTPVPCRQLAEKGDMPERFLLQILRSLVTHGILQSARGVDGGYMLDRKPQDISLLDVIEAIDGPLASDVPDGNGHVDRNHEKLRGALGRVTDAMRSQLKAIKLAHLIPMKR